MRLTNLFRYKNLFDSYALVIKDPDYRSLFILNFGISVLGAMLVPVFPLWVLQKVKISVSGVFFILAIVGVGSAILNIILGYVSDKIGKQKIFIEITLLLSIIRGILYSFFPLVSVIIAASWLTQVSSGALSFAMLKEKIIAKNHLSLEGKITSTVRASISIAFVLGPWLGITLVNLMSFEHFYLLYAALYFGLYLLVKFKVRDSSMLKSSPLQNASKTKIKKQITPLGLSMLLIVLLVAGNLSSSPLLVLELHNYASAKEIGIVFGAGPLFEVIAFPIIGHLNDKYGTYKTLLAGSIIGAIYFYLLSLSVNVYFVIACQIVGTLYVATLFSTLMIYIQKVLGGKSGFSSSFYFSAVSLAGVFCNALLGTALAKFNYSVGFLILGLVTCSGIVLLLIARKFAPSFVGVN
jgi:MFS family permease